MEVWMANIKADSDIGADLSRSCIKRGVIGLRGLNAVPTGGLKKVFVEPILCKEAENILESSVENNKNNARFIGEMKIGDLIWAKDTAENYFLGRVVGDYNPTENNRRCEWHTLGQEDDAVNELLACVMPPLPPIIRVYKTTRNSKELIKLAKITYNKKSCTSTYNLEEPSNDYDVDLEN